MVCTNASETTHHIVIDNVKKGEIISYSLLICKGHIENLKDSKCSPLPHILIGTTSKGNVSQTSINPKTGTFKFLIDLKLGENILHIMYCCTSLSIALEYKPRDTNLTVIPLYIICEGDNGKFQAPERETNTSESACSRITTGCKMIQSLFAEKLYESGLERKSFQIQSDCVVFHSKLHTEKAHKMGQLELWYYFAREIMSSNIGSADKKYLAFLSCTTYDGRRSYEKIKNHEDIIKLTKGYVAFGGEGLALIGTGCLYTWPESISEIESRFQDSTPVDRRRFMDDSCYRGTLGGCYSTTLGATLHELCHTFDLGHTKTGIMDRGFDNIQNVFLPSTEGHSNNICDIKTDKSSNARFSSFYLKHKEYDDTYWTQSCLAILNYHRWFNSINSRRTCTINYNAATRIIKSTAGLRVIEIRTESNEMVLKFWVFMDKVLKYSFKIDEVKESGDCRVLVVVDNDGNILKQNI